MVSSDAAELREEGDYEQQALLAKDGATVQDHRDRALSGSASLVPHEGTGSVAGTIFNILSNVVGGGVLALPYAFANCGWLLGAILLIFVASLSGFSMWILMTCSHRLHINGEKDAFSYKAMMKRAFGPTWGKVVEAFIVWYTFGCCVAYAGVTGTSLAPLAENWIGLTGAWDSRITWTLIAGILFAITSSARNLSELKFTSALAFITILYVGLVVVVRLISPESGHPNVADDVKAVDLSVNIFKAIPLFSVSYGCHYNIPVFYEDLKDRNPKKMTGVIIASIGIITVTYLVIATTGYLHFGKHTNSYILQYDGSEGANDTDTDMHQFGSDDTIVNIARLGMFLHFGFVFPLICIACRRSLNLLFDRDLDAISWGQLVLQSLCIVGASVGLAIAIKDIGTILDINGSLFGVFIIITFPGFLLRTLGNDTSLFPQQSSLYRVMSGILIVTGLIFSVTGFIVQILTFAGTLSDDSDSS
eukprot:TRINITY_DN14677_c0_g1_i1.p1 TRINITY_DN14677_c0_g1~~TRINITY_DN14677_c0_g1_i1.p1  ORF type:complete len:476 (+),score=203.47 TRINITY_DN14677_c0_g1_i1:60-1487(+)